jgi:cytochrome c551/c552
MLLRTVICQVLLIICLGNFAKAEEASSNPEDYRHFESKIRPLLVKHCYECHSSESKTVHGGLRLDTDAGVKKGGDSGSLLVPRKPAESLLIEVLGYKGDIQMPPEGKLSDAEIAEFVKWVASGAPIPVSRDAAEDLSKEIDFEAAREFWSFQPVREHPEPPRSDWAQTRIDGFVLKAMKQAGLSPAPPADRATLIRRLYFDLVGLPPSPEEVQKFVRDDSPLAYERLVDQLLQSPQYGERWARMWLDKARYTDKTASWLNSTGGAYLYRDWVVRAFNDDMPYDEFVHRQLATDLMPETGPDDLPALGFISLSPTYWKELKLPCEIIKVIVADEWEERVDAVSRTFLGLTVACARCHDHKFDPISSEDYYALAGVFASCRQTERPLMPEAEYAPVREAKEKVAKLEAELATLKKKSALQERLDDLTARIQEIKSTTPGYDAPLATAMAEESLYVVRAGKTAQDGTKLEYRAGPQDLPLFVRGDPNRPGSVVPRRFLTVLSQNGKPEPFRSGSGRLELARAITTDAAPLAARVIVNRIWLEHFGRGLVDTPSNFGAQGARPTHPELLDDLAARFIAGGWSVKDLHREILLSKTWRQSSSFDEAKAKIDPENRWLSRMNRRRLDFESWRDAMLFAAGRLDLTMGGPSLDLASENNRRRTLYATIHRRDMSPTLQIHDFPDPTQHSPKRHATVTALQGLYALNAPLLANQAKAIVERTREECGEDPAARIGRAYWLLYSRPPSEKEQQLGLTFINHAADAEHEARWIQYIHVLLVSNEFAFVE